MNWIQDLQFAFRLIRKNPWFSAAIVVTLALGMGVNTTIFSLVNGVLYKPLPFPGGDRLVMVAADTPPPADGRSSMCPTRISDDVRGRSDDSGGRWIAGLLDAGPPGGKT